MQGEVIHIPSSGGIVAATAGGYLHVALTGKKDPMQEALGRAADRVIGRCATRI